ncbi:MAG: TRAP transporter small permease [Kiloniellales bacterium]|nr:TRAP transporter small permease [Kiloniellales bacterium]MDJ0980049.1 TRAP transporter small permease [Kiloniellales bacterium]
MARTIYRILDNIESYICRTLLALFVVLLFAQILSRELFNYSFSWSEELATYMFVWFVFFGASYAAKLYAHNRVTFQFNKLPKRVADVIEGIADLFWIAFNVYFVYLSFNFVFFKMNLFWKSQTLGIPMKYIYLILPIAFTLMTIRIIQANYLKLVKGIDVRDPEKAEVEKMIHEGRD